MATDTADDDYNPFTEEDIQKILKEEKVNSSEEGWSFVKKNELSEIWRKGESDSQFTSLRPKSPVLNVIQPLNKCGRLAFLSFPGIPPDKVVEMICDLDRRKEWDKEFPVIDVVESHKHYRVVYWVVQMPPGVTNRDVVQHIGLRKDEATNTTYILYKNASHKDRPETRAHVRAETILSGVIVRPDPDNTGSSKMSVFLQNDVKGWIPHFIVNAFAARAPENWRESLATYYKEHYAGGQS